MKVWCLDYRDQIYTDAAMQDVARFGGLKFFRGAKLAEHFPHDATVEIRSRRTPSDYFRAGVFRFVSSKLRSILESNNVEAEYLQVNVVDTKNRSIDGKWWCFNPTLVLDWFDWSQSEYVSNNNFATDIKTIAAKEVVLRDAPLAVAARTIPVLVAVSDSLAATIIDAGCTGVVFRKTEEWTNPVNPVAT